MTALAPRTHTVNILSAYLRAGKDDIAEGLAWYDSAHALAVELDPDNVSRAAGVIAALSPMLSWPRNVSLACAVYAGSVPGCLQANARKALAIYAGADPLAVLGGAKVRAFFATILDPAESQAVVVDRHAIDIAAGTTQSNTDRQAMVKGKRYEALAESYRLAAVIISGEWPEQALSPAQLQAVVWVWWRRNYATANHG